MPPTGFEPMSWAREAQMLGRTTPWGQCKKTPRPGFEPGQVKKLRFFEPRFKLEFKTRSFTWRKTPRPGFEPGYP